MWDATGPLSVSGSGLERSYTCGWRLEHGVTEAHLWQMVMRVVEDGVDNMPEGNWIVRSKGHSVLPNTQQLSHEVDIGLAGFLRQQPTHQPRSECQWMGWGFQGGITCWSFCLESVELEKDQLLLELRLKLAVIAPDVVDAG